MSGYHLRRKDREIQEQEEIVRILKNGKYAIIALAKKNDPYIVTLSYGYDEELNALYFHCAKRGKKLEYITENPQV